MNSWAQALVCLRVLCGLRFSFHSPKRSQAEICERSAKAYGDDYSSRSAFAGLVAGVLAGGGKASDERQEQKNRASDFQPELVQHPPEGGGSRAGSVHDCRDRAVALNLLAGNPRQNAQFTGCRKRSHGSILSPFAHLILAVSRDMF